MRGVGTGGRGGAGGGCGFGGGGSGGRSGEILGCFSLRQLWQWRHLCIEKVGSKQ